MERARERRVYACCGFDVLLVVWRSWFASSNIVGGNSSSGLFTFVGATEHASQVQVKK